MKKKQSGMTAKEEENLRKNPVNEFTCCGETIPFDKFKEHLFLHHKLSKDQWKGKKSMLMHLDGDRWFSSNYQWELESGLKFTQYVMMARTKDDMMRFDS